MDWLYCLYGNQVRNLVRGEEESEVDKLVLVEGQIPFLPQIEMAVMLSCKFAESDGDLMLVEHFVSSANKTIGEVQVENGRSLM